LKIQYLLSRSALGSACEKSSGSTTAAVLGPDFNKMNRYAVWNSLFGF